jgi:hypothetical protein
MAEWHAGNHPRSAERRLDQAKAALAADGIAVTALPADMTDRAQIAAAKIDQWPC